MHGLEDDLLVTFDSVGKFTPVELSHAIVSVLVVDIVVAKHGQTDAAPWFVVRARGVVQALRGRDVVVPDVQHYGDFVVTQPSLPVGRVPALRAPSS